MNKKLWVGVSVLVIVASISLGVGLDFDFKDQFIAKCNAFTGIRRNDCEEIWKKFESAYVGKDPCKVEMDAYDPLFNKEPFKPECSKMMFWSKTKASAREIAKKTGRLTLEDTLLGSVLDGLTWCGKKGSNETWTTGCPAWDPDFPNTAVGSFWNKASAGFAEAACGDVTVVLNGDIAAPFDPKSTLAKKEVPAFTSKITSLTIILLTKGSPMTNCKDQSLQNLWDSLAARGLNGLKAKCEVTEVTNGEDQSFQDLRDSLAARGLTATCEASSSPSIHHHLLAQSLLVLLVLYAEINI